MPGARTRYDDLRALSVSCEPEHDARLQLMAEQGVEVDTLCAAEQAGARGGWTAAYPRLLAADLLVVAVPADGDAVEEFLLHLRRVFAVVNRPAGRPPRSRVGACLHTGPSKRRRPVVDVLREVGYAIPYQSDRGWQVGGAHGLTFLTWDLLHLARRLKDADAGAVPVAEPPAVHRKTLINRPYQGRRPGAV